MASETYLIGDKVVHPKLGAGIVEDIVLRADTVGDGKYYVFRMPVGSMTVSIPVESAEVIGVRRVVDAATADSLLKQLASLDFEREHNWTKRFKENLERLKSGDPDAVVAVVRSLSERENVKGLSMGERKMFHSAMQMLVSEISLAKDLPYEETEALVHTALGKTPKGKPATS